MKADFILLLLVVATCCAVILIQTIKLGAPPAWFESSIVPVLVAVIMSIKFGMEKKDESDK